MNRMAGISFRPKVLIDCSKYNFEFETHVVRVLDQFKKEFISMISWIAILSI